jgi:hypothetical protein
MQRLEDGWRRTSCPRAPATETVQPGLGAYLPALRQPAYAKRRRFFTTVFMMPTT